MRRAMVLVIPYPAQGHVNPLMTFSLKLVENGLRVIFVNTEFDHKRVVSSMVDQQQQHDEVGSLLKLVSVPDGLGPDDDRNDLGKLCDSLLNTMPLMLEKFIEDVHTKKGDENYRIGFIVADLCMGWALDVGSKFGIKGAILCPASASFFALLYNIPTLLHHGILNSDFELASTTKKTISITPTMPDMNPRDFFWLNMGDAINGKIVAKYLIQCTQGLNLAEWWLCNTMYEIEPGPFSSIPKLLPIGPLLRSCDDTIATTKSMGQYWKEDHSCMSWLEEQPQRSVIYVAFGSHTFFDQTQFNEIALGLDLTDRPFLWVVREDNRMEFPNEFLGSKGKIVNWAPQQCVLSHNAIACFVTHCGWNSTMEGLSNGVPFLCWPYFGDQIYNKTHICDELKVGLGFEKDKNRIVSRKEIKRKVDQLLNDENIKTRSLDLKEKAMSNIAKGGPSLENLNRFLEWLKE